MKLEKTAYLLMMALLAATLYSCANIGRPEGGPRDVTPPIYLDSKPTQNQLNFKGEKVEITFNEYIQLKDQMKKVVVSPTQKNSPVIRSNGKKVTVELRDTLLPNTTYCIDFADCIQDLNESNPLDGFAIAFSTGDEIDSMQVSGTMLRARDLEPMQSILVGLQENLADSAFATTPLTRVARTNEYGQFTLRNLKPGQYHVFGLNDIDGNYTFSRSEDMAFIADVVVPSCYSKETVDTIFKFNGEIDTIQPGVHTMFEPNNLFLAMFNEEYHPIYLKKNERTDEGKLHILFSAPVDTLPELRLLKPTPSRPDWYRLQRTAQNDSLFYWLTDSNLIKSDTILVETRYLRTDSLDNLTFTTDTLKFNMRHKARHNAEKAKGSDNGKKKSGGFLSGLKKLAGGTGGDEDSPKGTSRFDSIPGIKVTIDPKVEYSQPLSITFETPVDSIWQPGVHLKELVDTAWTPVNATVRIVPYDSIDIMHYKLDYELEAGTRYTLDIDSMAIYDCFGNMNAPQHTEFNVPDLEEYSNLTIKPNVEGPAFVELLNASDAVVDTATVVNGEAVFEYVRPGNYYARLVIDTNGNGKWDTGNYAQHLQPEDVFYYPKRIVLKKNWDVEQTWDIYQLAVDKQKPMEIKKNKPKAVKDAEKKKKEDEEDDDDDEGVNWGVSGINSNYTGNQYNDMRNMQATPVNRR